MFRSRLRCSTRLCRRVGFVPLSFAFVPLRFRPAVHRVRSAVVSASSLSSSFAFGAPSAPLALQCPTVVVVLEDPRLATLRAPQVARDLTSVKCVCHSSHSARQASSFWSPPRGVLLKSNFRHFAPSPYHFALSLLRAYDLRHDTVIYSRS